MIVEKVMTKKVITLKSDYSMFKAAQVLYDNAISGAPVINDKKKIVGIISEKDVFRALHPSYQDYIKKDVLPNNFEEMEQQARNLKTKKVKDFMNRDLLIVTPQTPIMKAGALMLAKGYNRIPVEIGRASCRERV